MTPAEGLWLLVALGVVAWWWAGLRAREAALRAAREATECEGLQLLDSAVAGGRSRLARGASGHLELHRHYRFEFSDDGLRRLEGEVRLRGRRVIGLTLAPWRVSADDPATAECSRTPSMAPARVPPATWSVVRGGRHARSNDAD